MKRAQVLNDKDIKRVLAAIAKRSYSSRDRTVFFQLARVQNELWLTAVPYPNDDRRKSKKADISAGLLSQKSSI